VQLPLQNKGEGWLLLVCIFVPVTHGLYRLLGAFLNIIHSFISSVILQIFTEQFHVPGIILGTEHPAVKKTNYGPTLKVML
jgi:hypothetical protein